MAATEIQARKGKAPAQYRCECGRTFEGGHFTWECYCGRFYNWGGQQLSHPRNWGEETGERFDDHGRQVL